ncbi:MAG: hypothetical protein NTW86_00545 [Candidatus Sumerlaeota bacterium]|nr:hypothetical protein [Candidatus Sumerlaeota bacterium]
MSRIYKIAGALMLLSGVTHVSQVFVYGYRNHVIGAAAFGVVYLVIGALLFRRMRLGAWLGATLPVIGGVLGAIRYATMQANPFSLFHIGIDIIVVPICIYIAMGHKAA